jgi:predicted nucleic acid-binding protein
MNKLLIDSDVILDLLLKRQEYENAAIIFTKIADREVAGYATPIIFANVHYVVSNIENKTKGLVSLRLLRTYLNLLTIDEKIVDRALQENAVDFEDAIQYHTAKKYGMDFIISRNIKDFKASKVPALRPGEYLKI